MSDLFGLFFPFMDKEKKEGEKMENPNKGAIRGVSWNAYVGNRAIEKNLKSLIKTTASPHFLCLQEMYRHTEVRVPNYRPPIHGGTNVRDANNMILVRDDVDIRMRRDINVNGNNWTGPESNQKGNQPPRYFPGVTLGVNGREWDVWSVHRCTGGFNRQKPENMSEWNAEHRDLVAKAGKREDRQPDRPGLYVGDWNCSPVRPGRFGIKQLAREIDGQMTVLGIDGVIHWNCRIPRARKLLDRFGSDTHAPVVFMAETR